MAGRPGQPAGARTAHESALAPVPPASPSPAARTPAVSGLGLAGPPMPGPRVGRVSDDLGNERATGRDDRVGAFGRAGLLLQPAALRRFGLAAGSDLLLRPARGGRAGAHGDHRQHPSPAVLAGAVDDRPVLHGPPRTGVDGLASRVQLGPLSQQRGTCPGVGGPSRRATSGLAVCSRIGPWPGDPDAGRVLGACRGAGCRDAPVGVAPRPAPALVREGCGGWLLPLRLAVGARALSGSQRRDDASSSRGPTVGSAQRRKGDKSNFCAAAGTMPSRVGRCRKIGLIPFFPVATARRPSHVACPEGARPYHATSRVPGCRRAFWLEFAKAYWYWIGLLAVFAMVRVHGHRGLRGRLARTHVPSPVQRRSDRLRRARGLPDRPASPPLGRAHDRLRGLGGRGAGAVAGRTAGRSSPQSALDHRGGRALCHSLLPGPDPSAGTTCLCGPPPGRTWLAGPAALPGAIVDTRAGRDLLRPQVHHVHPGPRGIARHGNGVRDRAIRRAARATASAPARCATCWRWPRSGRPCSPGRRTGPNRWSASIAGIPSASWPRPWPQNRLPYDRLQSLADPRAEGDRSMFSVNEWLAYATPFDRKMDQSPPGPSTIKPSCGASRIRPGCWRETGRRSASC